MVPTNLELPGGYKMPILGFGTWQATDEELESAMELALKAGYRHIDTAYVYDNEHVIGRVLKRWITSGKVNRKDLFIVTKLPPGGTRPESVAKYMKKSLESLQLDYLDQYLMHVPFAFKEIEGDNHPKNADGEILVDMNTDHLAIWKEMEKLVDAGLTHTIGISNFNIRQIERILSNARIRPVTLQIELHVYFQQNELVDFCKQNSISVTAYSPLGSKGLSELLAKLGVNHKSLNLLEVPVVKEIATKHGETPAQVLLRYTVQRGIAAIPKSTNAQRLKENISIFDFKLDNDDVAKLKSLDQGAAARVCDFSFMKGIEKHPEFPF
ncbi:uncharacterized protein CBL_03865 [Carabus blaptoides fortunei]